MKTKKIPPLIMLLGGLGAAVASYMNHYPLEKTLTTVLIVLIIFYILGIIAKILFDKYIPPQEEADIYDEGSVIEKQTEDDDGEVIISESEDESTVPAEESGSEESIFTGAEDNA